MRLTAETDLCLAIGTITILVGVSCTAAIARQPRNEYAEILILDEETKRGVPLVELTTVNGLRFVTDNAGRIAFQEPGLMGRSLFFHVQSHGYGFPPDGFGNRGEKLRLAAGKSVTLKLRRQNVAERLYRITGEGLYRDSILLGRKTPLDQPLGAGKVAGQDSAFAVPYRDRIFWFWGDTSRMSYPLGHFWMAGATSKRPESGGLHPAQGVNLQYFVDDEGFSRPMCRLGVKRGLIWADAFATVRDVDGRERLVCHFAHMESLGKMLGHGLAIYDDDREKFQRLATLELRERWRWPTQAHPVHHREEGTNYLLMGNVYPTVRVSARLSDFTNLDRYEAWSCLLPESTTDEPKLDRGKDGKLRWRWRRGSRPVDHILERKLIEAGLMQREEAHGQPIDVESGEPIRLHRGSVNWNPYRNRWIMIACQQGGSSNLGEIWYSEATEPMGPWRHAVKVVTHERYSFYNPVHHAHFDQDAGRLIYFEGTYTNMFSGNDRVTPRYNYNQVMYQLDLSDRRLRLGEATTATSR